MISRKTIANRICKIEGKKSVTRNSDIEEILKILVHLEAIDLVENNDDEELSIMSRLTFDINKEADRIRKARARDEARKNRSK